MTRARDLSNDEANNGGATPPFVAGKNKIINGGFDIWQRGTTTTSVGYFTADRWYCGTDATATFSRQVHTPGAAPVAGYEGQYFMRLAKNSGGSYVDMRQYVEDVRTLAGQTVTLSFWAKCGSGTESLEPYYSQDFGASGSAGVSNSVTAQTITTAWARYSFTFTLPSVSGKTIGANSFTLIYAARSINSSSARTIDVWGVQLEAGPVATPFTPAGGGLIGAELALCQRYYVQIATGNSVPISLVWYDSASLIRGLYQMPVVMRTNPTLVQTTGTNYYATQDGDGFNSLTLYNSSANVVAWYNNTEISGTNSRPQGINTNNASASLGLSAEL